MLITAQGARSFSPPPPPPPADAALVPEELVTLRVRQKLQGELRLDRQELFNKIDGAFKSLDDKMGNNFQAVNTKLDALNTKLDAVITKIDALYTKLDGTKADGGGIQAGAYALGGATLALCAFGLLF